jgi:hypothetical protein
MYSAAEGVETYRVFITFSNGANVPFREQEFQVLLPGLRVQVAPVDDGCE